MYKILLADDEYLEREALKIIISNQVKKAQVIGQACSGKEAVEISERLNPDMILMDIKMPEMNGLEAAEIIRNKDENTIIIILSAYDEFQYAQKAIRVRAHDYLLKPVRPDKIVELVEKYINNKEGDFINDKVQDLLNSIKNNYYKKSKDVLKQIINHFSKIYNRNNIEYIRMLANDIAYKMVYNLNQIDLNNTNISENLNYKQSLSYAFDVCDIGDCLLKLLDEIFNEIINNKQLYKSDDLNCALNYIEKNFKNNLTLNQLSKHVNLSSTYLSKLFKQEMNVNFIKYINLRRIEEAKEILKNTKTCINDIAFDLGYNEPNYFCRVFKKIEGVTPTQYRNNLK
ncbi:MAG: response regulator [Tepidibacter sp.]|jgi:two-component system response regulator YesN|uniref:response regulator transcription factor n=1 Tax=Tepidibacter sp. TaxID=2529387 RepID=UPI0025F16EAC|nr:response regulator [Tepidibacter sp.]MCT4509109.1 response regulator [Tepidibacter sp.]